MLALGATEDISMQGLSPTFAENSFKPEGKKDKKENTKQTLTSLYVPPLCRIPANRLALLFNKS